MALGHAAGVAAHIAVINNTHPRAVSIDAVQETLLDQGAVLVYLRDVPRNNPDFRVMQQFALRGFFEGFDAELERPITYAEGRDWQRRCGVTAPDAPPPFACTRGQFLKSLHLEVASLSPTEAHRL